MTESAEYLIRILYKSGNSIELWCTECTLTKSAEGHIHSLKIVPSHPCQALAMGLSSIEAVWQIGARASGVLQ